MSGALLARRVDNRPFSAHSDLFSPGSGKSAYSWAMRLLLLPFLAAIALIVAVLLLATPPSFGGRTTHAGQTPPHTAHVEGNLGDPRWVECPAISG
jgi:hypothetical protein